MNVVSSDTVRIAPSLDTLINEFEVASGIHKDGGKCDFQLGKGNPLSSRQCVMCSRLSSLMDLMNSWKQPIDSGRLNGRMIEIVGVKGKLKDLENGWLVYRDCETAQRNSSQFLIRRYHASFTCDGKHYHLREATSQTPIPLNIAILQLFELFFKEDALPRSFSHGNPTASSISFLGKLPFPVKHKVQDLSYFSRYLIQVDCNAVESSTVIKKKEPIGAIQYNSAQKIFSVHKDANFDSFLNDYPFFSKQLSFFFLLRGVASFYSPEITRNLPFPPSKAQTLKQAFEEIKGKTISMDFISSLFSCMSGSVMT